jgi:hypothetical protein
MPFDANGVYTPPAGAEDATPGATIHSATWNSIFTDISAALTQLGQSSYGLASPVILSSAGGTYTVVPTDAVVIIQANTPTITLPLATSMAGPVRIFGGSPGIFSSAHTTVVPTNPESINGTNSFVMVSDYQTAAFYPLPNYGYLIF